MARLTRSNAAPPFASTARVMATTVMSDAVATSSPRSSRNTTNSDDSDGLVKRNESGLNRRGIAKMDVRMSGALAPEDVAGARLRPPTGRQRAALSKIAREADHSRAIEALKRRRDEALAKERGEQLVIPSSMPEADAGATDATGVVGEYTNMAHGGITEPAPVAKLEISPAGELSVLGLGKFKRRLGQPSVQQTGRNSELEKETAYNEELENFQPNDESTPFHLSAFQPLNQRTPASHATSSSPNSLSGSHSRKRKLTPPEVQIPQSQPLPAQSGSPTLGRTDEPDPNIFDIPASEEDASDPELPSARPKRIPSPPPQIWSDTMAPPQSSSPTREKDPTPARSSRVTKSKAKKTAPVQPSHRKQQLSRRPITTASHDPPESAISKKQQRKSQPLKPITTANLQNLLPRRRRRQRRPSNEFDLPGTSDAEIDNLSLDEDEDELSLATTSAVRVRKRQEKVTGKKAERGSKSTKPVLVKKPQPKSKAKAKPPPPKAAKATKTTPNPKLNAKEPPEKTYTRRASDKENTSLISTTSDHPHQTGTPNRAGSDDSGSDQLPPDDTTMPASSDRKVSRELQTLARKFREVDEWALEFEEVTASSSSPRDGR